MKNPERKKRIEENGVIANEVRNLVRRMGWVVVSLRVERGSLKENGRRCHCEQSTQFYIKDEMNCGVIASLRGNLIRINCNYLNF